MKKVFKNEKIIFIIILLIGVLARTILIGQIPKGIHVDEAGIGYDAFCLAEYGVDRHLYKNPVYLTNFGGGQSALYVYLAAICIKIFGFSLITVRMPAVICSIIAFILMYFIVKENTNKKMAVITFALLAICPWHIMQSRWSLDCNLLSSFLIISLFFLTKAINKNSAKYFIISRNSFWGNSVHLCIIIYINSINIIIDFYIFIICKKSNYQANNFIWNSFTYNGITTNTYDFNK